MQNGIRQYFVGLLFLLILLVVVATPLSAAVVGTEYYDVTGDTLEEVWDSIKQKSPAREGEGEEEKVYAGLATSDWDYTTSGTTSTVKTDTDNNTCPDLFLYTVTVDLTIAWTCNTTITLPNWTDRDDACAEVQAEWDRFVAATTTHEEGHDQVAENVTNNALKTLRVVASACDAQTAVANAEADLNARLAAEEQRVGAAVEAASDNYDTDTDHGTTQGAVLDVNVVCDNATQCSGCFIATAAYGSPLAAELDTFRAFRDQYLITNPVGSRFVSLYYRYSPPVAGFIDEHPALKPIVRTALLPPLAYASVVVNTTLAQKAAISGSLTLIGVAVAVILVRRRNSIRDP